jgi:hypothetical protein
MIDTARSAFLTFSNEVASHNSLEAESARPRLAPKKRPFALYAQRNRVSFNAAFAKLSSAAPSALNPLFTGT